MGKEVMGRKENEMAQEKERPAGSQSLFHVNLSKGLQCIGSLFKTDTSAVDKTDDRRSCLYCQIIKPGDLFGMHFADSSV